MVLLNSGTGNYVFSNGKKYSYFAGNNYLGLAGDRQVKEAAIQCIKKYGVNFAASRSTTGTADLHLELEKQLSVFKESEDAVVFASGYLGNSILLEILLKKHSTVFIDQFSHPSIRKSLPADISEVHYYNHLDAGHLEFLMDKNRGSENLIMTDGIFALTGEIAPLDKIFTVAEKHQSILIVDDAHSTGILGKTGKGTPEYFNLAGRKNIYQTETMSKAIGSYGGFIAGSRELTGQIRNGSAAYQASTALPPPVVAASIASLKIIGENPGLHHQLLEKAFDMRKRISLMGYDTTEDNTPIIPLMLPSLGMARDLSLFLEDNGLIVPFIHYPVKLEASIVRIAVSVSHTAGQIEKLIRVLKKWREKYGKD